MDGGGGGGGGHLGATNTWPEDSKELGSSDCMSATRTGERERRTSFHLPTRTHIKRNREERRLSILTLQLQHHVAQVGLDEELVVRRQDQTQAGWREGGQSQRDSGSRLDGVTALTVSPVVCAIDSSPGVTPLHLIHVLLQQEKGITVIEVTQ